jgi:uncharacterized OsmC-like protein
MVKTYPIKVNVNQQDGSSAIAQARHHQITLNVKKASGEAGFTAAEAFLASLGACLLTNLNAIGAKMHLEIDDARVEFDAERIDDPASITKITYRLIINSAEPQEKLNDLFELSRNWGTVTNTIISGITPQGELVIEQ